MRSFEIQIENKTFIMSYLTIMNVTVNNFGYYWCVVRLNNSDTLLPNPSMILHLSNVCASGPVCNSSLFLYHQSSIGSCANHDDKTIIFSETLQCIQPTSMIDNTAGIQPTRAMPPPATLPLQTITGKSSGAFLRATSEVKTYDTNIPSPHSTVVYTAPLPTGVVSDGAQNLTGSDNVIRPPDFEEEVNTTSVVHSMKLPSPCSTVVYTEPLPTVMVSDGDSDTQLNWLYVGIAMTIVLTAIAVILILIICIRYKKKRGGRQSGKVGSHSLLLSAFVTVVLPPRNNS